MFTEAELRNLVRAMELGNGGETHQDEVNACAEWCWIVCETARKIQAVAKGKPGVISKEITGYSVDLE